MAGPLGREALFQLQETLWWRGDRGRLDGGRGRGRGRWQGEVGGGVGPRRKAGDPCRTHVAQNQGLNQHKVHQRRYICCCNHRPAASTHPTVARPSSEAHPFSLTLYDLFGARTVSAAQYTYCTALCPVVACKARPHSLQPGLSPSRFVSRSIAIAIRFPASRASLSLASPRPAHQHQSFHLPFPTPKQNRHRVSAAVADLG